MAKVKASSGTSLIAQISAICDQIDEAAEALVQLNAHAKKLEALQAQVSAALAERSDRVADLLGMADTGVSQAAVLTRLRALEKSSSAVLLRFQTQMQHENRAFTAVSNVLKARHDTVKNSIGNVR